MQTQICSDTLHKLKMPQEMAVKLDLPVLLYIEHLLQSLLWKMVKFEPDYASGKAEV